MTKAKDSSRIQKDTKHDQISSVSTKAPKRKIGGTTCVPIVSEGHPALRQISEEVPLSEISSPKIKHLIQDMKNALDSQDDGIGLAAPQIGVPLRIFIVSKKIFNGEISRVAEKTESAVAEETNVSTTPPRVAKIIDDVVFINPTITKYSKEKKWMEGEGCLSVRWVYGKVQRSTKVTIRAYDENGKVFERGAGGLLAHIFQHEVDHLNGILFIDRARDLEEVDPAERNSKKKNT
jgi:peptide deformylase